MLSDTCPVHPDCAHRKNKGRKRTPEDVEQIRLRIQQGWSSTDICSYFHISMPTYRLIRRGKYQFVGGHRYKPKLSPEQTRQLITDIINREPPWFLARKFGLSVYTIRSLGNSIRSGRDVPLYIQQAMDSEA